MRNTNWVKFILYQSCFLEKPLSCVVVRMQPELVSLGGGGQEVGSVYPFHCRIKGNCWKGTERLKWCHIQSCEQVTVYKLVFVLDTFLMMTGLRGFLICLISGRSFGLSVIHAVFLQDVSTSCTAQLDYKDLLQNLPQNQAIIVERLYMDIFQDEAATGGVLYLNKPVCTQWNTRTRGQTRHQERGVDTIADRTVRVTWGGHLELSNWPGENKRDLRLRGWESLREKRSWNSLKINKEDRKRDRTTGTNWEEWKWKQNEEQTPAARGSYFVGVVSAVICAVTRLVRRGREEEERSSASAQCRCQNATVGPPVDPQRRVSLGSCR